MTRILIDISHPAHAHFFRFPALRLKAEGCEVLFTSREKEFARELLASFGFEQHAIAVRRGHGFAGFARELVQRDSALAKHVRKTRPDVIAAVGGTFAAHAGFFTRTPSVVFYDTENANLQNLITYPFATRVVVPDCYQAWLPRHHVRYAGYHELSYLHPSVFTPDAAVAARNGVTDRDTFFLRLVSWQANHDIGERGWNETLLQKVIDRLEPAGTVLISSEAPLPSRFDRYRYRGAVKDVHHVLASCRAFVGESATMASECAVLGTPAIYAAWTGRGYTDEQEKRYGLVRNVRRLEWEPLAIAIDDLLARPRADYQAAREQLLRDKIAVPDFVANRILAEVR